MYNEVSKVEVLIQLVGMDAQRIEENFKVLWRDGSAEDLIGILQLKVKAHHRTVVMARV